MKEQDDEYAGFWVRTIAAISDRTQILTALITYPLLISMANKVLARMAARAAEARSSNLGHDNLTEILAKSEVLVGKLLKFTTPSARSMTLEEVERWFQGKMAELGTMLDAELSLKLQVEEAYMLKEHLLAGAKVALKYPEDIALFESWHPTTPLERLQSELSEKFSGKRLNQELLKKITALDDVERIVIREDGLKVIERTDLQAVGFEGATKIIVENGEHEDIEYIDEGRMVLSRCEKTGEMAYRKVIRNIYRESVPIYEMWVHGHNEEGDYYSSGPTMATAEHPFWVKGKGWVPLSELQAGDALESCYNYEVLVKEIKLFHGDGCVFNMEVEGFNTFFLADMGVWVHNCSTNGAKEVERWFQAEMAKLSTMVDANLSLKLQVEEAYMLKEHLLAGAKVALKYTDDAALFESWHPTQPLERLRSELSEKFSGKKLNQELLKKITALDDVERVFMREDGFKVIERPDIQQACFDGETKIIVENGEYEEIQYISVGQMVLSRCEKTGEMAYRKVIRNIYREDVPIYEMWVHGHNEDGRHYTSGPIVATAEHPFWVKGKGWIPLSELQPDDALESCHNVEVLVESVKLYQYDGCVFNLEVEGFNTFFLAERGVWVHNCGTSGAKAWELLPQEGVLQTDLFDAPLCEVEHNDKRLIVRRNETVRVREGRRREDKLAQWQAKVAERNAFLQNSRRASAAAGLAACLTKTDC